MAGRKPERGWSTDADFFECFFVKKLGQERSRRNAQERGVVVSLKTHLPGREEHGELREGTRGEVPDE